MTLPPDPDGAAAPPLSPTDADGGADGVAAETDAAIRRADGRPLRLLTALEIRILGVLVEKERTVPDTYPLSLNALQSGCNQKSSRDPVMQASEADLLAGIDELRRLSLLVESSGGRVMRYAHNLDRVLGLSREAVALVTTLMLRGPQTAAELRANTERLARFADVSSVEGYLEQLASRGLGGLVLLLARRPGSRESRWAYCLAGPPGEAAGPDEGEGTGSRGGPNEATGVSDGAALAQRVAALEAEVAALRATLVMLCDSLGMERPAER